MPWRHYILDLILFFLSKHNIYVFLAKLFFEWLTALFRWLLCSFVHELAMWKSFAFRNILLIINGLFSVTSNVKDIYTFSGDHPPQFGREVHFGDLCSSYQRMIPVCDCGNREGTWNSRILFRVVAGGHWVVTVTASHLSHTKYLTHCSNVRKGSH